MEPQWVAWVMGGAPLAALALAYLPRPRTNRTNQRKDRT